MAMFTISMSFSVRWGGGCFAARGRGENIGPNESDATNQAPPMPRSPLRGAARYQEKKNTIADGLLANLGAINFALVQRHVDDVLTVSEEAIVAAMRTIWETMKIVIEPSAAVAYAAVLEERIDLRGKRVGIILTGGNVDLDALPWMK